MTILEQAAALQQWRVEWLDAERDAWRPPEHVPVSRWCDLHRVLPASSAEQGPWRTDRTPYLRELLDGLQDRHVEQITLRKSTQVGGTELLLNAVGWVVDQAPQPIVYVVPRDTDTGHTGRRRIRPLFTDSPSLRDHIPSDRADWAQTELAFRNGAVIYLVGANSPADLASKACGVLIGDECDKWPGYAGKEASPFDLARERTRTYPGRKILLTSTPVLPDGLTTTEYERGDRRHYHVPCPHCGTFQVLSWDRFRYDDTLAPEDLLANPDLVAYPCVDCGEPIRDHHKPEALRRGVWVPDGAELQVVDGQARVVGAKRTRHRSYQLWAAYSPWLTWAAIAAEWLRLRETEAGRQHFANSWLGEPFREVLQAPEQGNVRSHIRAYERDTLPPECSAKVLTLGCDVQKHDLVYTLRAWGDLGESWLVRSGRAQTFAQLEAIIRGRWGEKQLPVVLACLDSRYRTDEVLEFARVHDDIVRAIKGVDSDSTGSPFTTHRVDRHPVTGQPLRTSLVVWHVRVDPFRARVVSAVNGEATEGARAWHLHSDIHDQYVHQLASMERVRKRTKAGRQGDTVWQLRAGHRRKDFFDAEVYALVAATMARCDNIGHSRLRAEAQAKVAPPPVARAPQRDDAARPSFLDVLQARRNR